MYHTQRDQTDSILDTIRLFHKLQQTVKILHFKKISIKQNIQLHSEMHCITMSIQRIKSKESVYKLKSFLSHTNFQQLVVTELRISGIYHQCMIATSDSIRSPLHCRPCGPCQTLQCHIYQSIDVNQIKSRETVFKVYHL